MKVTVEIVEADLTNGEGKPIPGICATCGECGEQVEVFGRTERSYRRAMVMLNEECPNESSNYYTWED